MTPRTKKPKPTVNPLYRVVRGGSWNDSSATSVRAACRIDSTPLDRNDDVGFRTAQSGCRQSRPAQK